MNDRNPNPPPFEMAERARQFRLMLDNIDVPICYCGRDLVFHFVNRQYAEFIGPPESQIPGRRLEIDRPSLREITTDPDDKAITAAIIALAHSLDLDVVAEGVKAAEQLAFLTERGCNYYQGHYFSELLESAGFIELVSRYQGGAVPPQHRARAPIV